MTILIRRAHADDAPALTALMHDSSAYRGEYAAILADYAISPAQIARDAMFVAEDADAPLGFYSLANVEGEPELDLLFVSDAAQGRGLGALLFRHMLDTARALDIGVIKIVSHPPAEGFYRRMGAKRIGTTKPSGRVAWPRTVLTIEAPSPAVPVDAIPR
ncbi:MAG: GNAT family N-acetyltransferase [Rhodanobacteraceae bacterium]